MNVSILTGPAASGKNTISQAFAEKRNKCAVIDVDIVRWFYRQPHKAPWDGEEGKEQQKFGVENACLLAKNFVNNNVDVVILDVVVNETAKIYKELLPEAKIVLLLLSYEETLKRFQERPHTITQEEFNLVYQWQKELTVFDEKIDNTQMNVEETAERLNELFTS